MAEAALSAPSPFLVAHLPALVEAARLGPVLDLASGRGRHALAVAALGAPTLALDRDAEALVALQHHARQRGLPLQALRADAEKDHGLPVRTGSCGAILVFCFLYRPLCPALVQTLRPGGLLLYETFTQRQRGLGHGPRNPAFLLQEGELETLFPGLVTVERWEGVTKETRPRALARLAARRPTGG